MQTFHVCSLSTDHELSQVQGSKTHDPAYRMCLFCSHGGTRPDEVCGFVFEKLRNRNQLEACLIAPGLEDYFQSSLKVEIFSAVLMTNVSLWANDAFSSSWTPLKHLVLD